MQKRFDWTRTATARERAAGLRRARSNKRAAALAFGGAF